MSTPRNIPMGPSVASCADRAKLDHPEPGLPLQYELRGVSPDGDHTPIWPLSLTLLPSLHPAALETSMAEFGPVADSRPLANLPAQPVGPLTTTLRSFVRCWPYVKSCHLCSFRFWAGSRLSALGGETTQTGCSIGEANTLKADQICVAVPATAYRVTKIPAISPPGR